MSLCFTNIIPTANTHAESFQSSEQLQFTLNPTISISISGNLTIPSLSPGDSKDSNIITITASSNAISGYTLSSSVGSTSNPSTELRKDGTDTTNKFTSITANKPSLSDFATDSSTWGYSYSTDSGTTWQSGDITGTPALGYNGLPLYTTESPITLINSTDASNSIQFKIGANATSTQVAGEYTNAINFIGVANANPEPIYMQDATLADCGKSLYDRRDNNSYTTANIGGSCWMTQNLRISGIVSSQYSNFTGGNFNISAGSLSDDMYGDSFTEPRSAVNDNPVYGAYYNYCAASAGTVCGEAVVADATSDVCPSGWHLPTLGDYETAEDYDTMGYDQPPYWDYEDGTNSGYYQNGIFYDDSSRWWAATAVEDMSKQYSADNYFGYLEINSNLEKSVGASIRCIMK